MQNHTSQSGAPDATYQLGRRLSAGSTGDVYEATHPWLPGAFVVKVLRRALAQVPSEVATFQRELGEISGLRHPNIAKIVELGTTADGLPFVVMERLAGRTLDEKLRDGQPLPPEEVVAIVDGIANGLQAAHGRGVVHRELRPESVFLAMQDVPGVGVPKLLNFGIARLRNASGGDVGVGADHARYMSPEQAQGRSEQIDGRTDQFALAALAYRMLTGKDAFRGDDAIAVLFQVVHEMPEAIADQVSVRPGVDVVIRKGLAKRRSERFDSTVAFARALSEAAAGVRVHEEATSEPRSSYEEAPTGFGVDARTQTGGRRMKPQRPSGGRVPAGMAMAGGGVLLDDSAVWRSEADAAMDVDDDDDLRVPRQRWKLGVFVLAFGGACLAASWWAGWRPPQSWQSTQVWHALRLPHIERPARAGDQMAAPAATPSGSPGAPTGGTPSGGPAGPGTGLAAAVPGAASQTDGTAAAGTTATGTPAAGTATTTIPPAPGSTVAGSTPAGTTAAGTAAAAGTTAAGSAAAGTTAVGSPAAGTTSAGASPTGLPAASAVPAGTTAATLPVAGTTAAGTPAAGTTSAGAVAPTATGSTSAAAADSSNAARSTTTNKRSDRSRGRTSENARYNGVVWSEAQQRLVPVGSVDATSPSQQPVYLERRVPAGSSDSATTQSSLPSLSTPVDQAPATTTPSAGRPNIEAPTSLGSLPERAAPVAAPAPATAPAPVTPPASKP